MAGLYPDPDDPMFAARLFNKREFYEARAVVAAVAEGSVDPCTSAAAESVFELTPVQRIVSRFMHPLTPYMGMLLYHGVGVGKTCSAVTIAEQFLESSSTQAIILVPQALKDNFKRTVFDKDKLKWNEKDKVWISKQCTGTSYLDRLGLMENPDKAAVVTKIEDSKRARYKVIGYQAFANWIEKTLQRSVPAGLTDPVQRKIAEDEVLRRVFSDHLIIVDEAHNLRDLAAGPADAVVSAEAAENQAGKALNPFLQRIVLHAEGLRLVLMTATPMYNSAPEIVLLLNYLLMNDSKKESSAMRISDLFSKDGDLLPGEPQKQLERAARRYVSYMRGENPFTFPLRMRPEAAAEEPAARWPVVSATKRPVELTEADKAALNALPIVLTEPVVGSPVEKQMRAATSRGLTVAEEGSVDDMLDSRMQKANMIFPNEMYGINGFEYYFGRQTVSVAGHKLRKFAPKEMEIDSVFAGEGLRTHAPKIHRIVDSVRKARGISFIYSRYVKAGSLLLAIALERAGFQRRLADGQLASLLTDVPAVAPICAICGSSHDDTGDHPFHPACYVLLTSDDELSPKFAGLVQQAANWNDPDYGPLGSNVKVIIGSQVASEGLDLKCIREVHILDSWYHLNRTDQIIGRAIRYCSHTALRNVETRMGLTKMSLNNCLIYLHCLIVPETADGPALETADMYAYRVAITKAQMVGKVQRLLKKNAWDCNLEFEAITFAGLPTSKQIDAQGRLLEEYSINDQDYTTYCDYQVCSHECAVAIVDKMRDAQLDASTFLYSDARQLILAKQKEVQNMFSEKLIQPETTVQAIFADLPWEIQVEALLEIIDRHRFKITRKDKLVGYLVKKAGYLVFQPFRVSDTEIPLAMRYAHSFQLRRHFIQPRMQVLGRAEEAGEIVQEEKPALDNLFSRWDQWIAYVASGGKEALPPNVSPLWGWILDKYSSVPESRTVALRWWFEKVATYPQQRALLERAFTTDEKILQKYMFVSKGSSYTYRILDPEKNSVQFFGRSIESKDGDQFKTPASSWIKIVDERMGNKPVNIPNEIGSLLGFIVPKDGKIVFKSLEKSNVKLKGASKKPAVEAQRSVGAECGGSSNLRDHRKRVRILHSAGNETDLEEYMLPDEDPEWQEEGAKERSSRPEHLNDMTHPSLCLYMEFLTRLFDERKIGGVRWFLNAVEASQTNMMVKR